MLTLYTPDVTNDLLLFDWWAKMGESGELEGTFSVVMATPSSFLANFQAPAVLFYAADEQGIYFAMWFDPILSGAFFGIWCREDHRHQADVPLFYEGLSHGTAAFGTIIGALQNDTIAQLACNFPAGFVRLGVIPKIFDGEDATIIYLTRDAFLASEAGKATACQRAEAKPDSQQAQTR